MAIYDKISGAGGGGYEAADGRGGQMSGGHSIESFTERRGFRTRSGFKTGSVKRGFDRFDHLQLPGIEEAHRGG